MAHVGVVGVGLVCLKHRELGVVRVICTLVAEVTAQLIHGTHAAHHQAFEVQLRGDTQCQIRPVGVNERFEGAGAGATVHRVQDWGLNLGETLRIQGAPDGRNNSRAHPQVLHLFRVNQQIGGAAAQARLRVSE